jgi:D-xylose transport system substrate-binding protein
VIDPNRRARPFIVAVAALAVVIAVSGAVSAQSPSPVPSPAPVVPSAAPSTPAASAAPTASPTAPGASPTASMAPIPATPVALLLPNTTDTRWVAEDQVAFSAKLKEVCPAATLDARNAGGDAATQAQQAQEALAAGAKVLVLVPVDAATGAAIVTSAHGAGAKVISYDTSVTGATPDYHVAYDPAAVGTVSAGAVITSNSEANAAASPAPTVAPGSVRVVLIDGPATDPASAAWTSKVKDALATDGTIVQEDAVAALTADEGQRIITAAIAALGTDGFDSVITSSDAVAGGVIAGLTAAQIDPATKQVTGGDATVPGVQQVLLGTQLLTTYTPPTPEAQLAAVVACGLATGNGLPEGLVTTPVNNGTADIPSLLLTGIAVTVDGSIAGTRSVADTIIASKAFGPDTTTLICTADVLTACQDNSINLPSASPSPGASGSPGASVAPSPAASAAASPAPSPVASAASSPAASVAPSSAASVVP